MEVHAEGLAVVWVITWMSRYSYLAALQGPLCS
jgi:ATP-dependent Clp protease adapter protein ClpS